MLADGCLIQMQLLYTNVICLAVSIPYNTVAGSVPVLCPGLSLQAVLQLHWRLPLADW